MDNYSILGLTPSATKEEVKRAYRHKVRQHHPDRGGDPDIFEAIHHAYRSITKEAPIDYEKEINDLSSSLDSVQSRMADNIMEELKEERRKNTPWYRKTWLQLFRELFLILLLMLVHSCLKVESETEPIESTGVEINFQLMNYDYDSLTFEIYGQGLIDTIDTSTQYLWMYVAEWNEQPVTISGKITSKEYSSIQLLLYRHEKVIKHIDISPNDSIKEREFSFLVQ